MDSVLIAIIVVIVLFGIFGLVILSNRKDGQEGEAAVKTTAEASSKGKMSPEEMWDKHIERLNTMSS